MMIAPLFRILCFGPHTVPTPHCSRRSFFSVGQDFKPTAKVHYFTKGERKKMETFETIDYHEPITEVFKEYHRHAAPTHYAVKWVVLFVLSVVIGAGLRPPQGPLDRGFGCVLATNLCPINLVG